MRLYMLTDIEGVAGVINFKDYCFSTGRYYDMGKRLLTAEVNAAVNGFFAGGFTEILVMDGHGSGAINPELLDPRVLMERGHHDKIYPWGLEEGFDALAVVGQHAKSGTPFSHLTHTGNTARYALTANGVEIGEYGEFALIAHEYGIPTIFASGEAALCKEAEDLNPGIVTAAVKWGLLDDDHSRSVTGEEYENMKLSARHMAPAGACALIEKQAKLAAERFMRDPGSFGCMDLHAPWHLVEEYRETANFYPFKREVSGEKSLADALNHLVVLPAPKEALKKK